MASKTKMSLIQDYVMFLQYFSQVCEYNSVKVFILYFSK